VPSSSPAQIQDGSVLPLCWGRYGKTAVRGIGESIRGVSPAPNDAGRIRHAGRYNGRRIKEVDELRKAIGNGVHQIMLGVVALERYG
jgi:hypothetical protein